MTGRPKHGSVTARRTVVLALVLAASFVLAPLVANADDKRIRELEKRLDQATTVIEKLIREVEQLKAEKAPGQRPPAAAPAAPTRRTVSTDSAPQTDARLREVEERLDGVEDVVATVEEKVGSRATVKAFDALQLDFGGFYNAAVTGVFGEDDNAVSLNRQTLEFLLKATLHEDWSLFAAQAFLRQGAPTFADGGARRDPGFSLSTGTDTVIAWGNYRYSDAVNIQLGRYVTPHGIINIEHFPQILLDTEQPQFLRPFSGDTIFPNFTSGAHLYGKAFVRGDKDRLQYSVYTGNFSSAGEHFNYGARLDYTIGDSGLTLGANLGQGQRSDTARTDYTLYGIDIRYDKDRILWKTEAFATDEDGAAGDRYAFYTQPAFRITDAWTAFYRFDYLDNGSEPGRSVEHALGLTFKPIPNIHLRGIYTYKDFLKDGGFGSANAHFVQGSATFSF